MGHSLLIFKSDKFNPSHPDELVELLQLEIINSMSVKGFLSPTVILWSNSKTLFLDPKHTEKRNSKGRSGYTFSWILKILFAHILWQEPENNQL